MTLSRYGSDVVTSLQALGAGWVSWACVLGGRPKPAAGAPQAQASAVLGRSPSRPQLNQGREGGRASPPVQNSTVSLQPDTRYSPSLCFTAVCTATLYSVRGLRNQWPLTVMGSGTALATSLVGTS